jgi:large subunit ribosomal protein L15
MPLTLHNLKPFSGSKKKSRRTGRGNASGRGTYSGRGQKGQRARSGGRKGLKILGLKRMVQNIPKRRGFRSLYQKPEVINVGTLNLFETGTKVTPKLLLEKHLVRETKNGVKILGDGELKVTLFVSGCQLSQSAKKKIEKAGGRIESKLST